MQKSVLLPRIGMCLDYVTKFCVSGMEESLGYGCPKGEVPLYPVGRGLVGGMRPVKQ